ncbi:hypothetical protein TBC1_12563 [Lentimicrobium saccharophilum]|uniref:Uncharacterized protein n=1 Tax=Lentimicrobium saccharophilum TaxID=1678841 RepID=A0A0S7C617_9BACT|nr:hypothetical protein TBC1_12563 [Lentimicrobium saccharophilum]
MPISRVLRQNNPLLCDFSLHAIGIICINFRIKLLCGCIWQSIRFFKHPDVKLKQGRF